MFAEVVDTEFFLEANRRLGLAAASVSRQINGPEDTLNAQPLNRSTGRLSLTNAGKNYSERVLQPLSEGAKTNAAVG